MPAPSPKIHYIKELHLKMQKGPASDSKQCFAHCKTQLCQIWKLTVSASFGGVHGDRLQPRIIGAQIDSHHSTSDVCLSEQGPEHLEW